jgi:hypothetical protein
MGTIIRRSVAPLNCSRTSQAVRGYETVCHSDDQLTPEGAECRWRQLVWMQAISGQVSTRSAPTWPGL